MSKKTEHKLSGSCIDKLSEYYLKTAQGDCK